MKQIETISDILRLPWVSTDELDLLPDEAGVYFVMLSGGVIYIGKSQSLLRRWVGHHRLEQITDMGDADIHYLLTDATDAGCFEAEMIKRFSPVLNNTRSFSVSAVPEGFELVARKKVSHNEALMTQLSEIRGKSISLSSFYEWLSVCGISSKGRSRNGYTEEEVELLKLLALHLRDGYTYKSFADLLPPSNQSS